MAVTSDQRRIYRCHNRSTLLPSLFYAGECPSEILAQQHRLYPGEAAWTWLFVLPSGNIANNLEEALSSVEGADELDGLPGIFTCMAHNATLMGVVGYFPEETANEWKSKGWRDMSLWGWVGDYYGGLKKGVSIILMLLFCTLFTSCVALVVLCWRHVRLK